MHNYENVTCEYFDNIKLLKQFYEHQNELDTDLENEQRRKLNQELKYVKTLSFNYDANGWRKFYVRLPATNPNKSVYKNLRCVSKQKSVDDVFNSYELIIGGSRIDKLNGEYDVWRNIYGIDDKSVVPFHFCNKEEYLTILKYYEIAIAIEVNEAINFDIMIDVYEWQNNINQNSQEYSIMKVQYDYGNIVNNILKHKLNFSNICTHIVIKSIGNEIEDVSFNFNDDKILNVPNNYITKYNNCYIIPLTKSLDLDISRKYCINFSCINVEINIKFKEPIVDNKTHIYALTHQNVKIMNGTFSLIDK